MHSAEAMARLLQMEFTSVLDIGAGPPHAEIFRKNGKQVVTNNLYDADLVGDYIGLDVDPFDCIWASHVLEHQVNPGRFLQKCFRDLTPMGILAVTVPPRKDAIVGGHVTLWNAGVLLYQLILAGFDCRRAMVKSYGYNISVIVRKVSADLPLLRMDAGDIERLAQFFPLPVAQGFDGNIAEVNWNGP